MGRPSEGISAAVGSIVGAIFIIIGAMKDGFDVALTSTEFQGAVIVVVSWLAAGVTWYVARQQRAGEATSAADGTVG